jgi:hypothetical protein
MERLMQARCLGHGLDGDPLVCVDVEIEVLDGSRDAMQVDLADAVVFSQAEQQLGRVVGHRAHALDLLAGELRVGGPRRVA